MLIVLYSWRVKPDLENQFIESWSAITAHLRKDFDSLGSRLHRGQDGLFYGYAQWKSAELRDRAFAANSETMSEAIRKMREAISESFPEMILDVIADYLILPERS